MGFMGGVASTPGSLSMPPQYAQRRGGMMMNANPAQAAAPAQTGQSPGQSLFNVQTSIEPQPIYSPQQTQYAKNQAMADAYQQSSMPWLLKQFDRPGMSRSAGTVAQALPQYAQGMASAGLAQQAIPFQDAAANAQNMLQGQVAREHEAQGLAGVLAGFQGSNLNFQSAQQNQLLSLLSQLMG